MRALLIAHWPWAALWALGWSTAAFAMMGIDKRKAKAGAWRISERALFLAAVLGGSPGAILGMRAFRHKTKHWYFKLGMPVILIAQLLLAAWILWRT